MTVGKRRQSLPTKCNKYKQSTYTMYSIQISAPEMHVPLITKSVLLISLRTWMMCVFFFFIGKVLLVFYMIKKTSPETKFVRLLSAWHLIEPWHEGVRIIFASFLPFYSAKKESVSYNKWKWYEWKEIVSVRVKRM